MMMITVKTIVMIVIQTMKRRGVLDSFANMKMILNDMKIVKQQMNFIISALMQVSI